MRIRVPAAHGHALELHRGQRLRVTDPCGVQVADLVVFNRDDLTEFLDTARTTPTLGRIYFQLGDILVTNARRPILEVTRDDVGRHDMQMAACDVRRYQLDFGAQQHRNCLDNLTEALQAYDVPWWRIPNPVNLFQNTPVQADGSFVQLPAQSRPGDAVELRALMDVVVAVSACPQDFVPINGLHPTPIDLEVLES
jgi:uncharacterized protein YcgI (DUF1989 family)